MQLNKLPLSSSSTTSLQITEIHSTTDYDLKDQVHFIKYNNSKEG